MIVYWAPQYTSAHQPPPATRICHDSSTLHVSVHAIQRFHERTPYTDTAEIYDFVRQAIRDGRDASSYPDGSPESAFLAEKITPNGRPICYRGLLLITSSDRQTIITVYPLPYWFRDNASDLSKVEYSSWTQRLSGIMHRMGDRLFQRKSAAQRRDPFVQGVPTARPYYPDRKFIPERPWHFFSD